MDSIMIVLITLGGLRYGYNFGDSRMRNIQYVQCNVDFGYQLSICFRTEEKNRKHCLSWPAARTTGSTLTSSQWPDF
jgi:hypothetical protein